MRECVGVGLVKCPMNNAKLLSGLSTGVGDMSVPLEVTCNCYSKETCRISNWNSSIINLNVNSRARFLVRKKAKGFLRY